MLSFLYQELVGGAIFFIGMWLVTGTGDLGLRGRPGKRVALLIAGFLALALIQGTLQWVGQR